MSSLLHDSPIRGCGRTERGSINLRATTTLDGVREGQNSTGLTFSNAFSFPMMGDAGAERLRRGDAANCRIYG